MQIIHKAWTTSLLVVFILTAACGSDSTPTTALDELVTEYSSPGGQTIELIHANEEAQVLVAWAFSRFEAGSMPEPKLQSVDFAAGLPECEGRAGWAITDDGFSEIGVCLRIEHSCRRVNGVLLTIAGKLCVLHELGHVWLTEYASEDAEQAFMDHIGATVWRDPAVAWEDRGVEQAAETIAWGLMDQSLEIIRLGMPPCDQLDVGFTILTETPPLVSCGDLSE